MAQAPVMTPVHVTLNIDPNRLGKVAKISALVWARDATGTAKQVDLAELDDASAAVWLDNIKDWKLKLKYRALLNQSRYAQVTQS